MMPFECERCRALVKLQWWGYVCQACGIYRESFFGRVASWWHVFLFRSDFRNRSGLLSSMRDLPGGINHAVRVWWRAWERRHTLKWVWSEMRAAERTNEALWREITSLNEQNRRFAEKAILHDHQETRITALSQEILRLQKERAREKDAADDVIARLRDELRRLTTRSKR